MSGSTRSPAFRPAHLFFVHSEVVSHLVPYCIFDQFFEVMAVSGEALMRSLVDDDAIRKLKTLAHAPVSQRMAVIES